MNGAQGVPVSEYHQPNEILQRFTKAWGLDSMFLDFYTVGQDIFSSVSLAFGTPRAANLETTKHNSSGDMAIKIAIQGYGSVSTNACQAKKHATQAEDLKRSRAGLCWA